MLFAGACVEQLLGLYNQQLIPLMGMANAPVRELLVQWLAPVRQAISSSAQPLSVQQAAMQLLSRMVQLLLSFGSSGGGYMPLGGGVSSTPAGCEVVLCVVEGLLRSLEGLSMLCSNNSSVWMEPGMVASSVQLWRAQIGQQQPPLPAGWLIDQLLQQLGA
jgi:hypothetical protein